MSRTLFRRSFPRSAIQQQIIPNTGKSTIEKDLVSIHNCHSII